MDYPSEPGRSFWIFTILMPWYLHLLMNWVAAKIATFYQVPSFRRAEVELGRGKQDVNEIFSNTLKVNCPDWPGTPVIQAGFELASLLMFSLLSGWDYRFAPQSQDRE